MYRDLPHLQISKDDLIDDILRAQNIGDEFSDSVIGLTDSVSVLVDVP
jgi:hypothetical protein